MSHRLKLRIILPVVLLNLAFIVCLVIYAAITLSNVIPPQRMKALLLASAAGDLLCLAALVAMLLPIVGSLERTLSGFTEQTAEIARGHIRGVMGATAGGGSDMVALAFKDMAAFLDQTLMKIIAASGRLFSSTVNLQGAAVQCSESAGHQQEGAHAIATAVEEMSQTIATIARNASVAADTSVDALGIVASGQETAGRAVDAAAQVERTTIELAGGIEALNVSVSEIGDIVEVINDIADQTNLLALNASIEAARSGEHGRGFAVVADEVRNLASRTIAATAQISGKISAVQRESLRTVSSMKDASGEVLNARARIEEVESSLRNITASFEQVNDQVTQIATAVEQQSATTAQVSASIEATSQMSGTLSAVSSTVRDEASTITAITDNLLLLLGTFRLQAHYGAARAVERIAEGDALRSMDRARQEHDLRDAVRRNAFVELLYITDATGRQVTSNIAADSLSNGDPAYGTDAWGKQWESRPWFRGVRETGTTYISELYRSAATGSFCCTIAVPIRTANGTMAGVLGADINVVKISTLG